MSESKTDERRRSESIPGINTKKINEPMWIIFTDKVIESISRINTRSLSETDVSVIYKRTE